MLLRRSLLVSSLIVILLLIITIYANISAKIRSGRQSQAQNILNAIANAQGAYFLKLHDFADSFQELDSLPLVSPRKQLPATYQIARKYFDFDFVKTPNQSLTVYTIARDKKLKSMVAAVFVPQKSIIKNSEQISIKGLICIANTQGAKELPPPFLKKNQPICAEGTQELQPILVQNAH